MGTRCLFALVLIILSGCGETEIPDHQRVIGGDPEQGRAAMNRYGCPSCHVIPGVKGARGTVGPPLTAFSRRGYVGGVVANEPGNLVRWITDPAEIAPDTAMPDLGVSEQDARHIAAYLYTLR